MAFHSRLGGCHPARQIWQPSIIFSSFVMLIFYHHHLHQFYHHHHHGHHLPHPYDLHHNPDNQVGPRWSGSGCCHIFLPHLLPIHGQGKVRLFDYILTMTLFKDVLCLGGYHDRYGYIAPKKCHKPFGQGFHPPPTPQIYARPNIPKWSFLVLHLPVSSCFLAD